MSSTRRAYDILRGYIGREYDRLAGVDVREAEKELEQPVSPTPANPVPPKPTPVEDLSTARQILGIGDGADFDEIQKTYERLFERSDPNRFPQGSVEREQAARIRQRIQWAHRKLTEGFDSTERRFRTLEID